jgi:uncharacterized coiled-coil protein SlyX
MDPEILLLFQGESFLTSITTLFNKRQTFKMNPALLAKPYQVRSTVSLEHFRLFLSALTGPLPSITTDNIASLDLLSSEFGFTALSAAALSVDLSARQQLELLKAEHLQQQLTALVDRISRSDQAIAELRQAVAEQQETIKRQQRELRQTGPANPAPEFVPSDPLDGIVAHLAKLCGGNDHGLVAVTSSRPVNEKPKNAADMKADSWFSSVRRKKSDEIPHTRNNWLCYDFKQRKFAPTHDGIRSSCRGAVHGQNLRSWLETSMNGVDWTTIDYKDNNSDLNGKNLTRLFTVRGKGSVSWSGSSI